MKLTFELHLFYLYMNLLGKLEVLLCREDGVLSTPLGDMRLWGKR